MSFKAVILLKSREAVIIKANARNASFRYGDGLYIITEKDIQNVESRGRILGAEAIYFEGNPSAVGYLKHEDNSTIFLDEIVYLNALKQTGSSPKNPFAGILKGLAPLKDPVNLMYILFVGIIAYGLIAGALGWV